MRFTGADADIDLVTEHPEFDAWQWVRSGEEIGTDRAEILAESVIWFCNEVPDEIAQGIMSGRYRGNRQKWFAMRFTGADADINLVTEHPEFDSWQWVRPEQLPELVVP